MSFHKLAFIYFILESRSLPSLLFWVLYYKAGLKPCVGREKPFTVWRLFAHLLKHKNQWGKILKMTKESCKITIQTSTLLPSKTSETN